MAETKKSLFSQDLLLSIDDYSKTSLLNTPNSLFMENSTTSEEQYLPSDEQMLEMIFKHSPVFTKSKMLTKIDKFQNYLSKQKFNEEARSYDDVHDKEDLLSTKIEQLNLQKKEKLNCLETLNSNNKKKI